MGHRNKFEPFPRSELAWPKCGRAMALRKKSKCPNLVYYICRGYYMRWKAKHCNMRWVRRDLLGQPVWRRVKKALSHPDLVLKQMSRFNEQGQVSKVKRNFLCYKINIASPKL